MNITEFDNKIQGLVSHTSPLLVGQHERVDELNKRILDRFSPDSPLQPNMDVRPVPTKYSHFPVIDRIPFSKVSLKSPLDYSVESNFAPITSKGPVDGYFSNVNTESSLRNQYFAIQRGAGQGVYIPSSNSDLYNVSIASNSTRIESQPFPRLFEHDRILNDRSVNSKIGAERFFNNTRVQLRGGELQA